VRAHELQQQSDYKSVSSVIILYVLVADFAHSSPRRSLERLRGASESGLAIPIGLGLN
jgi:hypothetical protein